MKEKIIAVVSSSWNDFESFVIEKYQNIITDKSMVVSFENNYITIEHPVNFGFKYICIDQLDRADGYMFDSIESTEMSNTLYEYDGICERVKISLRSS